MALRAVLDTDVWVAALLSPTGASAVLLTALEAHQYQVAWSEPLLRELREVLEDPDLSRRYRISRLDVHLLGLLIRRYGREVRITGRSGLSDDPGDDKVIETAIRGRAGYLVTFNTRHFAAGKGAANLSKTRVAILRPGEFLRLVREQGVLPRRKTGKVARRLIESRRKPRET